ncbi:hypothetical protein PHYSODRAFT_297912 [Phytophthora sojae]|uniref:Uncharacterized protein n=1 Tax=Phytophthora sojae (strain P6497) TaxID=1094619 RepID=G4Z2W5_PHYSP|nr:hypothetical protein PHYSODRAFT_297912 [Phytophthora sojae]EGZ19298.1 hypothetical protein PHYSODRAFT_297912 [Phytophthora sojae]|eukprot:XP_009522015.1 hypothetical protein PHYSODRAFT_297912 [Phytophthora sojae]
MSSNRIAPAPAPTRDEDDRVPAILSTWLSRYIKRYQLASQERNSSTNLIDGTLARQLVTRDEVFDRQLSLAWPQFVLGIISLALVFSDVPRSGLGVASVLDIYPSLQPDETMGFGTSWNYSVFSATKAEASSGTVKARVWSYKFDSTSIVWRVFAGFLDLKEFPDVFHTAKSAPMNSSAVSWPLRWSIPL